MAKKQKPFTVVLRYPESVIDDSFNDYFNCCVYADTPKMALTASYKLAIESIEKAGFEYDEDDPFTCVAMFEGDHNNINPE